MKNSLKIALVAALPLLGAAGCSNFLTGGELDTDPNRATTATINQRFLSTQENLFNQQEGQLARTVCVWMQQCAGTDRQYVALGIYTITEGSYDGEMQYLYVNGGLVELRNIQNEAQATGDLRYKGIVQVIEAFLIGTGADFFGSIPYSEAASGAATPKYDDQLAVYASIQTLLSTAITNLAGAGNGPGANDLVYGGDPTKWTQLANTLKARFYLHTAETVGATAYSSALTSALLGISSVANNYKASHRDTPGETNEWYQFQNDQRAGYLSAGEYLVNLLKARSDPRLAAYFAPVTTALGILGAPPNTQAPGAFSDLSATRRSPTYAQPFVTYSENQLIKAEAYARAGNAGQAVIELNLEKTAQGVPTSGALTGTALLNEILTEKYIALFQNIEVYNDYRRTCTPNLTPALSKKIPQRLFYGTTERQTNPNTPDFATQSATPRNPNNPVTPTDVLGNACLGGA